MKKRYAYLFGLASLAFFLLILLYIFVYRPASGNWEARIDHMNEHWTLISTIWSSEFIIVVTIAWVSTIFSKQNAWWMLVALGHFFMLVEYALMLGGYPAVSSEEGFQIVHQTAVWIFAASNFIWLIGMTGVYFGESGWIRYAGALLASVCGLLFLSIVLGLMSMEELVIVGPLLNLLYLLNGYYGFKYLTNIPSGVS